MPPLRQFSIPYFHILNNLFPIIPIFLTRHHPLQHFLTPHQFPDSLLQLFILIPELNHIILKQIDPLLQIPQLFPTLLYFSFFKLSLVILSFFILLFILFVFIFHCRFWIRGESPEIRLGGSRKPVFGRLEGAGAEGIKLLLRGVGEMSIHICSIIFKLVIWFLLLSQET